MVVCSATNVESCLCLKARKVWQRGRLRRWGRRRSDAELQRFNVCLSQRKTGIFETGNREHSGADGSKVLAPCGLNSRSSHGVSLSWLLSGYFFLAFTYSIFSRIIDILNWKWEDRNERDRSLHFDSGSDRTAASGLAQGADRCPSVCR